MKFTFVLQLDPYQIDSTEKDGVLVLSSPGNEMYRTVDWATVPERGDRIMIDNDQVPERHAMVGFWCEVASHSYRRDGILLVNLSPTWPREQPLPEEDGWTDVAPWLEPVEMLLILDEQGRSVFKGSPRGGFPVQERTVLRMSLQRGYLVSGGARGTEEPNT